MITCSKCGKGISARAERKAGLCYGCIIDGLRDELLWARDVLRRANSDESDYVNPLSEEWLSMARHA